MGDVVVLDYGAGNVRSVLRALERSGARATLTADVERVRSADRLVFPGQGAFPDCMERLRSAGLDEAVRAQIDSGRPFLGICLGLQTLLDRSEEHGGTQGLGVVAGDVVAFEPADGLKVPHMGWNEVVLTEQGRDHPVLASLPRRQHYYFVHSFHARPEDPSWVVAEAEHGPAFCAALARDNVLACQFHPEKSQAAGDALLQAWLSS